jgi:hypothetical protein
MAPYALQRSATLLAVALLLGPESRALGQSEPLVDMQDLTPQEHRVAGFVLTTPQFLQIDATGAEPRNNDDHSWWGREDERDTWPAAAWIIDARTRNVVWDLRTAETTRARKGLRGFSGLIRLPAGLYEAHFGSYVANSVSHGSKGLISLGEKGVRVGDTYYRGPYVDDGSYEKFGLRVSGAGRRARDRELQDAARAFNASTIVTLQPEKPGTSERVGFQLDRPADVEVYAIGELRGDGAFDFGWIQSADTRQPVWRMEMSRTVAAGGANKNRMAHDTLHLAAGRYVAYFTSDDSHSPAEWNAVPPYDPAFWGLTLRVADPAARAAVRQFDWDPVPEGQTIVSLIHMGDDELRSQGFTLRQAMDVRIYAMGECTDKKSEMQDYAWIVEAATRRRVWEMRCEDTEPAGGAQKNRLFDGGLRLEAGSYLVYYKSDDSHSSVKWNDAPPVEARYWGVSVFPASGKLDPKAVGPFERDTAGIVAELVKVRDDRRSRRFFILEQPTTIRVHALGEGVGGEMVDYGWIEEEKTGERVWEMNYRATVEAGGAKKNRLFDGTVRLPAGRYILFYQTDGSHAYGQWNADPPDDPEGWGITLRRSDSR